MTSSTFQGNSYIRQTRCPGARPSPIQTTANDPELEQDAETFVDACLANLSVTSGRLKQIQEAQEEDRTCKEVITHTKISSRFVSQYIFSSFSIFDPKEVPAADSSDLLAYGEDSVKLMLAHYGVEQLQPAETVDGDEYTTEALISPEIRTEWKTFQSCLSK